MQRAWAAILVVLFSFPLIAPALASTPKDSQLPACCRRNGKHHCAMQAESALGQLSSRLITVSEKCPYAPFTRCPLMLPHSYAPSGSQTVARPNEGPAAVVRAAEAGYRISADRARHKRGPPRLFSL